MMDSLCRFTRASLIISILTLKQTFSLGNLSCKTVRQPHQHSADNELMAANILHAQHQFCSTECLAMPATSNQDIAPELCGGYQVRGQSKGSTYVMSCSGNWSRVDRECDRGVKKSETYKANGLDELARADCRIVSMIRNGEINSAQIEAD